MRMQFQTPNVLEHARCRSSHPIVVLRKSASTRARVSMAALRPPALRHTVTERCVATTVYVDLQCDLLACGCLCGVPPNAPCTGSNSIYAVLYTTCSSTMCPAEPGWDDEPLEELEDEPPARARAPAARAPARTQHTPPPAEASGWDALENDDDGWDDMETNSSSSKLMVEKPAASARPRPRSAVREGSGGRGKVSGEKKPMKLGASKIVKPKADKAFEDFSEW